MTNKLRPLHKIAAAIVVEWRNNPPSSNTMRFATPYIRAMLDLRTCYDMYGLEYGDMIVAYALNNMGQWRGEKARELKAELKQHLEDFNATHHGK
jgi:hypothetical protein